MDRQFMFMEKNCPKGVVCPCHGAIYMYSGVLANSPFSKCLG